MDLTVAKKTIELHEWGQREVLPGLKAQYPEFSESAHAVSKNAGDAMARGFMAWALHWMRKSGPFLAVAHDAMARSDPGARRFGVLGVDANADPKFTEWDPASGERPNWREQEKIWAAERELRGGGGDISGSAG